MKKFVNGQYVEMTADEIADFQKQSAILRVQENSRPLTEAEVSRMLIAQQINTLTVDDNTAMRMKAFYPDWADCVKLGKVEHDKPGYKFSYGEKLFSCVNANPTFQSDWIPGVGTESLYTEICETHAGTLEDPVPYSGNMALENGKYYHQDYAIYLCTRDTVNPVYNALADLVGLYVTEI